MTRLPADGGTKPPLRRVARGMVDDLVLDLDERGVSIRPLRVRRPEARVRIAWGLIYQHALMARDADARKRRRRA